MSKVAAVLVALATGVGLLIAVGASANNDPHRIWFASAPFTMPADLCGFPVYLEPVANNEYATVSTLADGSTVYTYTGAFSATLKNTLTEKTITVNASGPGTNVYSPDFTTADAEYHGLSLLYATNMTDFGFPSNIVVTSGTVKATLDLTGLSTTGVPTVIDVQRKPHLLLDVCAALAP